MQSFPQVLKTWREGAEAGAGGSSSQYMKGEHEELKTLLENTCEGVHLLAKLPAKSLQI